jgi:molybdopterin-guanine dinucleotide biosynthesis protein B
MDEYRGIPVINAINETERLVSLIEEKVFAKLPDFPSECCTACGFSCRELGKKILAGEAKRDDCVITNSRVKLYIGGQKIEMVPFVQKILYNAVKSVVSELDGYKSDAAIKIEIGALNEE